jgi:hypothetical protein
MTFAYRTLAILIAAIFLVGCSSVPLSNVKDTQLAVSSTEIPENELLDVGIQTFSPGDVTKNQASEEGQLAEIRSAESVYIPYHLKSTLQSTGQWGAVWVTPDSTDAVDLFVTGRIVSSSGEHLVVEVKVRDATGEEWVTKTYSSKAQEQIYDENQKGHVDPYQDLYNAVANDILAARRKLTAAELKSVRRVSELKYAADLAPDAFSGYLNRKPDGKVSVARLPARDDPMLSRMLDVREREYMFFDTVNEHYEYFYDEMWDPYHSWRKFHWSEAKAYRDVKRQELLRKALGAASIVGGLAYGISGRGGNAGSLANLAIIGGAFAWQSGASMGREAEIHADAIRELGFSFEEEIKPQVVELEGRTLKLTGSAEQQYAQWRELLRRIYIEETGFGPQQLNNATSL